MKEIKTLMFSLAGSLNEQIFYEGTKNLKKFLVKQILLSKPLSDINQK